MLKCEMSFMLSSMIFLTVYNVRVQRWLLRLSVAVIHLERDFIDHKERDGRAIVIFFLGLRPFSGIKKVRGCVWIASRVEDFSTSCVYRHGRALGISSQRLPLTIFMSGVDVMMFRYIWRKYLSQERKAISSKSHRSRFQHFPLETLLPI